MGNKLRLLMKVFDISNNDLAELLQVHVSLVSKWRTGTRSFSNNQKYVRKFASYVMTLDKSHRTNSVRELLKDHNYNIPDDISEKELTLLLCGWLCREEKPEVHDTLRDSMLKNKALTKVENIYYWEGNLGRREAVIQFVEYAIECAPDAEILIYSTENASWFREDDAFLAKWLDMHMKFFARGGSLKIIHPMNRSLDAIGDYMLSWLPFELQEGAEGYYLQKYEDQNIVRNTIIVLKGRAVLYGVSSTRDSRCRSWYLKDTSLAKAYEMVAQSYLSFAKPLLSGYNMHSRNNSEALTDLFLTLFGPDSDCYLYNGFSLFVMAMKESLLRSLLDRAGLSEEEMQDALNYVLTIKQAARLCSVYFVIDAGCLIEYLQRPDINLVPFTLLFNRRIAVSTNVFIEHTLQMMDDILTADNIHVGLAVKDAADSAGALTLMSGGSYHRAMVSSTKSKEPVLAEIREPTVANAIYVRLVKIWDMISYSAKDKEYIFSYLKKSLLQQ